MLDFLFAHIKSLFHQHGDMTEKRKQTKKHVNFSVVQVFICGSIESELCVGACKMDAVNDPGLVRG